MFVTVYVIVYVTAYNENGDIPAVMTVTGNIPFFCFPGKTLLLLTGF